MTLYMIPVLITTYGIASIVAAIAALVLAPRRGRDGQSWAFWCFLLPPLAVLLYYLRPTGLPPPVARRRSDDDDDDLPLLL